MHLTPREQERLMIHMAGMLAGERKKRGLKLNYPEAVAYITSELLELARDGHSVTELMQAGRKLLTEEDVMDGVAGMITEIQLEATFPDGTKLVTVHEPIPPSKTPVSGTGIPGEVICAEGDILLNAGKEAIELKVTNTADRPIQVGSHFHFFEVNKKLRFDREAAFGRRLDIPSGTAVRFEPGESRRVALIPIGGRRIGGGLNGLTEGSMDEEKVKENALRKAKELGFQGVGLYD